jgi:hypothetical protein
MSTANKKNQDIDCETLLKQGKREIEKAEGYFADCKTMLERALAIQWLLDQAEAGDFGITEALDEMIEDLSYFHRNLNNAGEHGREDLTRSMFFEHVQMEFTKEVLDQKAKTE